MIVNTQPAVIINDLHGTIADEDLPCLEMIQ